MPAQLVIRNRLDPDNIIPAEFPTVAWSQVTYTGFVPNWLAQRRLLYDATSGRWFTYSGILGETSGIFSTNKAFCHPVTLACVSGGGTSTPNSTGDPDDGSNWTPNGPGPSDRHPDFQMAIDTLRGVEIQQSGLVSGTTPSDTWSYTLNADPTTNDPTLVSTTGLTTPPNSFIGGTLVYVPTDDVYWIRFSDGTTAVLARTASISSNQTSWGCVSQNAWATITPTGSPTFVQLQAYEWDPLTERILQLGVNWDEADTIEIWSYNGLTQTWTNKSPTGTFTKQANDLGHSWLLSRITSGPWSGKFLIVRNGTGASPDSGEAATYLYDSQANTITQLTTSGTGPSMHLMTTFVPTIGEFGGLIAHECGTSGDRQDGTFWHGVLQ